MGKPSVPTGMCAAGLRMGPAEIEHKEELKDLERSEQGLDSDQEVVSTQNAIAS